MKQIFKFLTLALVLLVSIGANAQRPAGGGLVTPLDPDLYDICIQQPGGGTFYDVEHFEADTTNDVYTMLSTEYYVSNGNPTGTTDSTVYITMGEYEVAAQASVSNGTIIDCSSVNTGGPGDPGSDPDDVDACTKEDINPFVYSLKHWVSSNGTYEMTSYKLSVNNDAIMNNLGTTTYLSAADFNSAYSTAQIQGIDVDCSPIQ